MPMYETGLPVTTTSPKIMHNGVDYALVLGTDTFTRVGKYGYEVVLPLCGGDEYVGKVLPGEWKKGWGADITPFTARINGGVLELGGKYDGSGDDPDGWINGHHPLPLMNELEVTVELESPTNDTDDGSAGNIKTEFYIRQDKAVDSPDDDDNYLKISIDVTAAGLLMEVIEEIGGTPNTIFNGSTYDDAVGRSEAAQKFTIWRILFHDGVAGADSPEDVRHIHIYLKQGVDRAGAEAATENQLTTSPYAIDDYLFKVGYPAHRIYTTDTTFFGSAVGSGDEAMSTYLRISYPALFKKKYNFIGASYGYGDVELWDPKGSATEADWHQVFDEDHDFSTYDVVLQNGLVRLIVDRVQQYGLEFYYWTGAEWSQPFDRLYFYAVTSDKDLTYPVIRSIESRSPEKIVIVVRLLDSATVDEDYYIDVRITLERGKYTLKIDSLDVFPDQDVRFWFLDSTTVRFGYVQDADIGDDDINEDGDNATPTDNYMIALDNAGEAVIGVVSTDEDPAGGNARFFADNGGILSIEDIDVVDTAGTIIWISLIPFALIAQLFVCASTMVKDGGSDTATPGIGEACAAVLRLDAQNEGGHWIRTAATHLPEGRYLAILRDRAITGVQNYDIRVYNNDDSEYRNEENAYVTFLAQITAWTYRQLVFDVTAADVATTDDIWIQVVQPNVGPNTVYIDYVLLIPISDGRSWPGDLAHAALRTFTKPRRLYVR